MNLETLIWSIVNEELNQVENIKLFLYNTKLLHGV